MQNQKESTLNMNDIAIIIPSYNPDEKLKKVVNGVKDKGFNNIIVVNDGSTENSICYFKELEDKCIVLNHTVNMGKGEALKTAYKYCQEKGFNGVVTIDGDNQHLPCDVYNCALKLIENPESLIIGCRDFSKPNVPFKSKYGNNITKSIFKIIYGIKLSDTQTGLRAFGKEYYDFMTHVAGSRYEYETNVLLEAHNNKINFIEVPIQTVYIDDNQSSHFNPIKDSIKIYSVILKFSFASVLASVLDLGLFYTFSKFFTFVKVFEPIFLATFFARLLSSFINYKTNQKIVFKSNSKNTLFRYYTLCIIQLIVSALLVTILSYLLSAGSGLQTVVKMFVDLFLFFISFQIQKKWVFSQKTKNNIDK